MTKYLASGLVVLALTAIAFTRLTHEPDVEEAVGPTHPTKVRERAAAPWSRPGEDFVIDLHFSQEDVEWSFPPFKDRYLNDLDVRLAQLEEKLALAAEQQDQAAAWRAQVAQRLGAAKTIAEAHDFATPRQLEAFLLPLLNEDQAYALASLKKDERSNMAASLRSGQFLRLSKAVGLTNERQAEIAAAIEADVEAVVAFRLDDPRPMEASISNFDKDPQALGIEQLMWESMGATVPTLREDHPLKRQFIKDVRARIDARVASMGAILTPGQSEVYREYLLKNWSDPFSQVLFPPLASTR